jgi:hypothetical protein
MARFLPRISIDVDLVARKGHIAHRDHRVDREGLVALCRLSSSLPCDLGPNEVSPAFVDMGTRHLPGGVWCLRHRRRVIHWII